MIRARMKVLVIDIGGTNVKVHAVGRPKRVKIPSGPNLTPARMMAGVRKAIEGWDFEAVTIGYPGPVVQNRIAQDPRNLGPGWMRYDFRKAFNRPVKIINDAAMQALGSYQGGRMLFLGLGTGLGTALVFDGVVIPLEVAHLPYRKGRSYEEYIGEAGFDRMGKKRWSEYVVDVVERFKAAFVVDYIVLGGGNARELKTFPPNTLLGSNLNAFRGGCRVWEKPAGTKRRASN